MSRLRWKQIIYHSYSNLIVAIATLGAMALLIPSALISEIPITSMVGILIATLFTTLIVGVICGFKFSQNMSNNLEELSLGARHLAYGDLSYRLAFIGDPELGDIAAAFNEMAERLEDQVVALQRLAAENEALIQKTKITAITEERQRLARDLHDAVSQQLFAISMISATASKMITNDQDKCELLIQDIEKSAAKAQAEMRALLLQLRPVTLQNQRLVEALKNLAEELQAKQAIQYELVLDDVTLPTNIENQLYRIAQEGLSNVLRHATASKFSIKLFLSEDKRRLTLIIEDDGQGFLKSQVSKTSFGIKSIKERALAMGGTAQWLSLPGQGTRLEVRVPLISNMGD